MVNANHFSGSCDSEIIHRAIEERTSNGLSNVQICNIVTASV